MFKVKGEVTRKTEKQKITQKPGRLFKNPFISQKKKRHKTYQQLTPLKFKLARSISRESCWEGSEEVPAFSDNVDNITFTNFSNKYALFVYMTQFTMKNTLKFLILSLLIALRVNLRILILMYKSQHSPAPTFLFTLSQPRPFQARYSPVTHSICST